MNIYTEDEFELLTKRSESIEILYAKTAVLITKWFKDKLDKGGSPYVNHLYNVASRSKDDIERIAGLLHDIIEDTPVTIQDLEFFGYPKEILYILTLLTRKEETPYDDYITSIIDSGNLRALHIKKYDMENNLDPSRLQDKNLIEKLHKKYEKNLKLIEEAIARKENEL